MSENQPYRHVMGVEAELPVSVTLKGEDVMRQMDGRDGAPSPHDLIEKYLPEDVRRYLKKQQNSLGMLVNGARLYVDQNCPEYASAEGTAPSEAVLSELAGEKMLAEALRHLVADSDKVETAWLHKRVIDDVGNSRAWHVNLSGDGSFLTSEAKIDKDRVRPLTMHFATSRPMLGAGAVQKRTLGGGISHRFSFAQKILDMQKDFSGTTTASKPIINMKNEALAAGKEGHVRIHIVGEDQHISPWSAEMTIGTHALMLAACHQEKAPIIRPGGGKYGYAMDIAKEATFDIEGKKKYPVYVDGDETLRYYTANEIQKIYAEHMRNVSDRMQWMDWVNDEWERFTVARDGDFRSFTEADGIAKLRLVEKSMQRDERLSLGARELALDRELTALIRIDKDDESKYSSRFDVSALMGKMVAARLRRTWFAGRMPSSEAIDTAMTTPSTTTTRARMRGDVIKSGNFTAISWDFYSYKDGDHSKRVELGPFEGADPII